ncbi:hypothetical protein [Domibacillus mangrovi]|uniref:Uncharacterized protein n=1 Tax=Domibacillus mangrovi TaxID=1714354 RepID=A0A1Q5NZX7_9BACI|nr:hypothetical protein [Domibacillus mangrovi]OKL35496.1 hypothetical protein BLL40_15165 [Domibacillus mangrovi]
MYHDLFTDELERLKQSKQATQWILKAGGVSIHLEATIKDVGGLLRRNVRFSKIKSVNVWIDDDCEMTPENDKIMAIFDGTGEKIARFGEKPVPKVNVQP